MDKTTRAKQGWYPHPTEAGLLRYWDGQQWTPHTAPVAAATPSARQPGVLTIARGVALGLGIVIGCLVMLGKCASQQDRTDCLIENAHRAESRQPLLHCPGS